MKESQYDKRFDIMHHIHVWVPTRVEVWFLIQPLSLLHSLPLSCLVMAKSLKSILKMECLEYKDIVILMYSSALQHGPESLSTMCLHTDTWLRTECSVGVHFLTQHQLEMEWCENETPSGFTLSGLSSSFSPCPQPVFHHSLHHLLLLSLWCSFYPPCSFTPCYCVF